MHRNFNIELSIDDVKDAIFSWVTENSTDLVKEVHVKVDGFGKMCFMVECFPPDGQVEYKKDESVNAAPSEEA
jgi:hypothetical protein